MTPCLPQNSILNVGKGKCYKLMSHSILWWSTQLHHVSDSEALHSAWDCLTCALPLMLLKLKNPPQMSPKHTWQTSSSLSCSFACCICFEAILSFNAAVKCVLVDKQIQPSVKQHLRLPAWRLWHPSVQNGNGLLVSNVLWFIHKCWYDHY